MEKPVVENLTKKKKNEKNLSAWPWLFRCGEAICYRPRIRYERGDEERDYGPHSNPPESNIPDGVMSDPGAGNVANMQPKCAKAPLVV